MTASGADTIKLPEIKLVDKYNRRLDYLRISVTDRCNMQCIYCMTHGKIQKLPGREILSYEEIFRLALIFIKLGISKIRVTGGEPLVRKGVCDFLIKLGRLEELSDLSITTNGILLKEKIGKIKSAGIKRLNISLDTLKKDKFKKITGSDAFNEVWSSIMAAHDSGFYPIKLNVVVLRGINDDELLDFAGLTFSYPFHIRFIEYMPIGTSHLTSRQLFAPEIKNIISSIGHLNPVQRNRFDGPAQRFKFENAKGEIGFIRPISEHFCSSCNRLRLTASGNLKTCLLSDTETDLKTPLRNGCSDDKLAEIILRTVYDKPFEHPLSSNCAGIIPGHMSKIGG
ncbi:GTP 3',8-cyclase MoaA [Desulfobacterium sp. N47]|uniref:GTP 3',8-cyclase n=1 Tax=uncultured Desulfobacterium sp. TaxID=201089 RepID=E1YGM8_9BACT|nr:Molybdenum cofactor biosynthesis protein A [uncultured Desulfobacterium sp.]